MCSWCGKIVTVNPVLNARVVERSKNLVGGARWRVKGSAAKFHGTVIHLIVLSCVCLLYFNRTSSLLTDSFRSHLSFSNIRRATTILQEPNVAATEVS